MGGGEVLCPTSAERLPQSVELAVSERRQAMWPWVEISAWLDGWNLELGFPELLPSQCAQASFSHGFRPKALGVWVC